MENIERSLADKETRFVIDDVKEMNESERSIQHWITVEIADRVGDIVRSKGMDNKNFLKVPTVLYGHNYSGFPIGRSNWQRRTERDGKIGVLAKTTFAPTDDGIKCFELWKGEFLNAASIGFKPIEHEPILDKEGKWAGGYDIKKWELFEYSIVPVPMNPEAVRKAISAGILDEPKPNKPIDGLMAPIYTKYLESRICDLEGCRDKMVPMEDVLKEMKSRLESIPNYGVVIEKLLERIDELEKRPVQTPGRVLNQEEVAALGGKLAAVVIGQMKGLHKPSQIAVRK